MFYKVLGRAVDLAHCEVAEVESLIAEKLPLFLYGSVALTEYQSGQNYVNPGMISVLFNQLRKKSQKIFNEADIVHSSVAEKKRLKLPQDHSLRIVTRQA